MQVLTTHQVAKLLGVTLPTVVNWIEAGKMEAYKTPGGHRRVTWRALESFCVAYNMPLPSARDRESKKADDQKPVFSVVISSYQADFAELLRDFLEVRGPHRVAIADTAFTTGLLCNSAPGGILIVHADHSNVDTHDAAERLGKGWRILALVSHEDQVRDRGVGDDGKLAVLLQPASLEDIGEAVADYSGKKQS